MIAWRTALKDYTKQRIFLFLLLGLSCGLPFNLINYSLSIWLAEYQIALKSIGLIALVMIPYSLKFLWAPFIDQIKIPWLAKKIGAKKAWGFLFQIGLMACIIGLAIINRGLKNGELPPLMFLMAFGVSFFSASQDIVVDALRIDTLEKKELGEGAGTYQIGYRFGMLIAGAGIVCVSNVLSWTASYIVASGLVIIGMIGLALVKEKPIKSENQNQSLFKKMVIDPFKNFMEQTNWGLILIFIILYKICNTMLGRMAGPFYVQTGFSKNEIAFASGLYGSWIVLIGIPIGGVLVMRWGILKTLFRLGFIEIATSLAFAILAIMGHNFWALLLVITFDNIVGGMGSAVFVAYLSSLCNRSYSATQFALLTSVMAISTSVFASQSGILATLLGWPLFFIFTGILMLPALGVLAYLSRQNIKKEKNI